MRGLGIACALGLIGCGARSNAPSTEDTVTLAWPPSETAYRIVGAEVWGHGTVDVEVRDGAITAVGDSDPSLPIVDLSGQQLQPGWVDSHVHLAYLPQPDEMAAGGIAVAVDLAAPVSFLDALPSSLEVWAAGPMITAVAGYPTQSWGANGYGLEVADAAAAADAVATLADAGARVIKVPLTDEPTLTVTEVAAVVDAAHARGLKVVAHATSDAQARSAAEAGVDVLAHTPTEALSDDTVQVWAGGAVISTLRAFGGQAETVDNLSRLRAAGATVLYGTDFGNTRTPGVDEGELALLAGAGLSESQIVDSGTTVPATFWGMDDVGRIDVGYRAVFRVIPTP